MVVKSICVMTLSDEWNNFMERLNCKKESEVWENDENILQLRHWVSLRGQTLCRTGNALFSPVNSLSVFSLLLIVNSAAVRGMMYYRRALKLQAFLDMASETGKLIYLSTRHVKPLRVNRLTG